MSGHVPPLVINGRFLSQPFSGVQRFAQEITRELLQQWPATCREAPTVLVPSHTGAHEEFAIRHVGRLTGQIWEQVELARAARASVLLNLGNTAPLLRSRQLVILHDAGIVSTPWSYSRRFRLWYRLLHTLLVRSRTRVVTVSEFSRGELVRAFGVPPDRIAVIGEGVDHIVRRPPDHTILDRHGLAPGGFALAVGNLSRHKNLSVLSAAARTLKAAGKALVVIGCGDSPVFNIETRLPEPAIYLGRIDDAELRALYEAAFCLLFPSRYEGFGLPVGEAMRCGCPVVVSNIPSMRELCGEAAIYAAFNAPDEFARAIALLVAQPQARATAIERGSRVAAALTWDSAVRRLIPHIQAVQESW